MMVAGIFYFMIPRIWNTKLYSIKLANLQFWTATIGLLMYMMSMWVAGITQGLMWRAIDDGGRLVYPQFVETVVRIIPMYWVRAFGGVLVLIGFCLMLYNIYMTIKGAREEKEAPALTPGNDAHDTPHRRLEGMPMVFTILSLLAILVGSLIEIVPTLTSHKYIKEKTFMKPYTPLELAGRDIYIKEGCYVCHSQLVRPAPDEYIRYGEVSMAEEHVYDRPFQWGSRRIGPDLARVGGKYNNIWHYKHMLDPRAVTPGSLMPVYPWLAKHKYDQKSLRKKMKVMASLGVPYSEDEISNANENAIKQAKEIATDLAKSGVDMSIQDKEMVALIAYLQKLGADIKRYKKEKGDVAQSEGGEQ